MRRSILACGLLLACLGMCTAVAAASGAVGASSGTTSTTGTTGTTTTSSSTAARAPATDRAGGRSSAYWSRRVDAYRAATARWLMVVDGRPPRGMARSVAARSASRLRWLAHVWHVREHKAWRRAEHPPFLGAWNCIHSYEGSWTDHGAPYWGGLQMDYSFQSAYGSWLLRHKGTADHWTPLEQIWVAVKAWRVRGFSPWPNTARDCGV
jgi:hypothetical protein